MARNRLKNVLFRLLEYVNSQIEDWSNGFTEEKVPYKKISAIDYYYTNPFVKVTENVYFKTFKELNQYPKFMHQVTDSGQYSDARNNLMRVYHIKQDKADEYLSQFIYKSITYQNRLEQLIDETLLIKFVDVFINEIENKPIDTNFKLYLDGLLLKKDSYDISNCSFKNMVLRRPNIEDFNIETKYAPVYTYNNYGIPVYSTAILEFIRPCSSDAEAHNEIEKIYNILLLYRAVSITKQRIDQEIPYSFLKWYAPGKSMSWSHYRDVTNIKYEFGDMDASGLPELIAHLYPNIGIVTTDIKREVKSNEFGYLEYAFMMYKESLILHADIKIRIAFAVTALETLYKVKDEKKTWNGKKSYTYRIVGERVMSLLKAVGYYNEDIFEIIKQAYTIRDAMYHGFDLKADLLQKEQYIYRSLLDYTRISLQVLIQLKRHKTWVVKQLDELGYDQKIDREIREFSRILQGKIYIS